MRRGELSNQAVPRFGIDFRILLESKVESRARNFVSSILADAELEGLLLDWFSVKEGSEDWVRKNFDFRAVAFTVGVPVYAELIEYHLREFVPEVKHFQNRYDFQAWMRGTFDLIKIYTNDPTLLGLDDITWIHTGWTERVGDGL